MLATRALIPHNPRATTQQLKRLGLRTLAEFVENDKIRECLRKLGVDFAQGYGIHKPEPIEAWTQWTQITKKTSNS